MLSWIWRRGQGLGDKVYVIFLFFSKLIEHFTTCFHEQRQAFQVKQLLQLCSPELG